MELTLVTTVVSDLWSVTIRRYYDDLLLWQLNPRLHLNTWLHNWLLHTRLSETIARLLGHARLSLVYKPTIAPLLLGNERCLFGIGHRQARSISH